MRKNVIVLTRRRLYSLLQNRVGFILFFMHFESMGIHGQPLIPKIRGPGIISREFGWKTIFARWIANFFKKLKTVKMPVLLVCQLIRV